MNHSETLYKLGVLDAYLKMLDSDIRQQQQAHLDARIAENTRRVAAPAAPPAPAPSAQPTYEEIRKAARAPRKIEVSSAIDPYAGRSPNRIRIG